MAPSPPTREQVVEALRPVQDPELHVSVVDLDMVRDVRIEGGSVAVTIALTVAGCPMTARPRSRRPADRAAAVRRPVLQDPGARAVVR
jgi:metal-sulfur cluster biosynthetic enzyme